MPTEVFVAWIDWFDLCIAVGLDPTDQVYKYRDF